jgi:lysozyme
MPPLYGVDVSHWQGQSVDFARLRSEGYSFAIAKCTEGTGYVDPTWSRNRRAIADAGLVGGGYHFLRRGDAAGQARHFLRTFGDPEGRIVVVDVEKYRSSASPSGYNFPTFADARAFVEELRRLIGAHPIVLYSGGWFWRGYLGNPDARALRVKLWDSHYVAGRGFGSTLYARVPSSWWQPGYGGWSSATILQFSSSGIASNVSPIDVNAFRGSLADLRALTRSGIAPAPAPTPAPQPTRLYHTVARGDTLTAIARRYGTTVARLLILNPTIRDPDLIYADQRLRVR